MLIIVCSLCGDDLVAVMARTFHDRLLILVIALCMLSMLRCVT